MKNLTKIFMAVAVALFAFSCVQDATEELGVKVGGQTELTLSIEESRTQLGEKAGSLYPVTWCEGDVVAVNGVASTGIEIKEGGKAATFTFPEAIARPWNVVYPATTATPATAGLQAVTFLATQEYKAGTFCDGAAPMYGVAAAPAEGEEAQPVQLNHLSGVLRLAVKGAGEKLTALTVTAESSKIAGNFDVDCATGALTAHADATNVVTVTFGEGLTLGEVATPIYVALPAGEHGTISLVLTTDDAKKMTLFFNAAGANAIKAATVREFREFTFEENNVESDWFEIYTVADMLAFAKNAANFPFVGAKLMATIDMTGVEWTPIEGFTKIFDGGNPNAIVEGDNGICIKNLQGPLFAETSATIKDLKLVDINVTTSIASTSLGALAYKASAPISNVFISGNVSLVTTTNNATIYAGGVVGYVGEGCSMTNVVNRANVSFKRNNHLPSFGGLVGVVASGFTTAFVLDNCHNYGSVTINSGTGVGSKNTYMGGLLGSYASATTLNNCSNHGDVYHGPINVKNRCIGGVIGRVYSSAVHLVLNNVHNYGNVTSEGKAGENAYVGGCLGYITSASGAESITDANGYYWNNVTNSGEVSISGNITRAVYLGGVVGYVFGPSTSLYANLNNIKNNATGTVTMAAVANSFTSTATTYTAYVGGCFGTVQQMNHTNSTNEAQVIWTEEAAFPAITKDADITYGGVAGYHRYGAATNSKNSGALITKAANPTYHHHIGGCFGQISTYGKTIDSCENSGNISLVEGVKTWRCRVGGIAGVDYYSKDMVNCVNSGNIEYNPTETSANQVYIAGIVGYLYSNDTAVTSLTGCKNKGNITVKNGSKSLSADNYAAGIVGRAAKMTEASHIKDCVNIGDITFEIPSTYTAVRVAGVIALPLTAVVYDNLQSYANIKAIGHTNVSGIFGVGRADNRYAMNSKVGGTICTETETIYVEEEKNDEGEIIKPGGPKDVDKKITIDGSNFHNYIYVTSTDWTWPDTTYDGGELLATKPVF